MFQLKSIDAAGICFFDIVVVMIVVELIDDPEPERLAVSKAAKINPCHIQLVDKTETVKVIVFNGQLHFASVRGEITGQGLTYQRLPTRV